MQQQHLSGSTALPCTQHPKVPEQTLSKTTVRVQRSLKCFVEYQVHTGPPHVNPSLMCERRQHIRIQQHDYIVCEVRTSVGEAARVSHRQQPFIF